MGSEFILSFEKRENFILEKLHYSLLIEKRKKNTMVKTFKIWRFFYITYK